MLALLSLPLGQATSYYFGRTSSAPGQIARDTRAYWGG
jgi:hypothetical protein